MKALLKFSFFILVLGLSFSACKKAPKGEAAKTGEAVNEATKAPASAKSFMLQNGQIHWTATKVGGGHQGTIKLTKGELNVTDGKINNGEVVIDINSLSNSDLKPGDGKEKLEGHLKSADFFDVVNHPIGSFKITSAAPRTGDANANTTITGNLTLKGITKSVSFPANVLAAGDKLSVVTPPFKINRTEWDIKYGSGLIGTAKDKIIHDEVGIVLNVDAVAN